MRRRLLLRLLRLLRRLLFWLLLDLTLIWVLLGGQ
jgi:hypothetical protein